MLDDICIVFDGVLIQGVGLNSNSLSVYAVCVSVCMPACDISSTGTVLMSAVSLIANQASLWDTHGMAFLLLLAQSELFNWSASKLNNFVYSYESLSDW
jgi:hypothetical protein